MADFFGAGSSHAATIALAGPSSRRGNPPTLVSAVAPARGIGETPGTNLPWERGSSFADGHPDHKETDVRIAGNSAHAVIHLLAPVGSIGLSLGLAVPANADP